MEHHKPSTFKRVIAYYVDSFIMFVLFTPLFLFGLVSLILKPNYWYSLNSTLLFVSALLCILCGFIYFVVKDSLFNGQSLGKKILKLRVVDSQEKSCSVTKSLLRNITLFFITPIEFIVIISDKEGRGIGDRFANTRVIESSKNNHVEKTRDYSLLFLAILVVIQILMCVIVGVTSNFNFNSEYNHYVYLKPTTDITSAQLNEAENVIKSRLETNSYSIPESKIENNQIVMKISKNLVDNKPLLKEILKTNKFEAKIGNEIVLSGGNKDIDYVCRSADCAGITPGGCGQVSGGYACTFYFGITLSPEAAERQAKLTDGLALATDGQYLNDDLYLYLDDKEVDRLRIAAGLKGRATTDIQISGSGTGLTQQQAINATLQNMKNLQLIVMFGSLPTDFEIVKIN